MKKFICLLAFLLVFTGCGPGQTIEERKETAELCDELKLDVRYNANGMGDHWVDCIDKEMLPDVAVQEYTFQVK